MVGSKQESQSNLLTRWPSSLPAFLIEENARLIAVNAERDIGISSLKKEVFSRRTLSCLPFGQDIS
jgi:hypothetical protein